MKVPMRQAGAGELLGSLERNCLFIHQDNSFPTNRISLDPSRFGLPPIL
jgi:hypothetical protein